MVFRIIPLENRKTVADFRLKVKRVLSKEVLSIYRVRKSSRIGREYISSYLCLSVVSEQQVSWDNGEELKEEYAERLIYLKMIIPNPMSQDKIDKMRKQVKNYRSSLDFDINFCNASLRKVGKGIGIGDSKPISVPGRNRQKILDIV